MRVAGCQRPMCRRESRYLLKGDPEDCQRFLEPMIEEMSLSIPAKWNPL
jgi:hypothetical protein